MAEKPRKNACVRSSWPCTNYLLLDTVDLGSQPLNHPVHLRDLLFSIAEIITMSTRCDLQFLVLIESEQIQSPHNTWAGHSLYVQPALGATGRPDHSLTLHTSPHSIIQVTFF